MNKEILIPRGSKPVAFLDSILGSTRRLANVILAGSLLLFPGGLFVSVAGENLSAGPAAANAATDNTLLSRGKRWKQDLEYFQTELPKRHKDFSKLVAPGDFDRALIRLKQNVTNLTDAEIVIGLMRIVAGIGVAHTTLDWRPLAGSFHTCPIQMRWLADGLVVLATVPAYREALGARVVKIGALAPEQLENLVGAYIPHENTAWLHQQSPAYMGMEELLKYLQAARSDGSVEYSLIKDGKPFTLRVQPVKWNTPLTNWVTLWTELNIPPPLTSRHSEAYYYREFLPGSRTLYLQYNKCADAPDLPFSDFAKEAVACAVSNAATRVVIDLRGNGGGNSEIVKPLIQALKKHPELSDKGHLYVLIGGRTFSSGADNALYLRDHLKAILVGKPTGGKPNCYGEMKELKLPNSQLVVFYPIKWFHLVPDGDPASIEPDIVVATGLKDLLAGRDPVLEAALAPATAIATRGAAAMIRR